MKTNHYSAELDLSVTSDLPYARPLLERRRLKELGQVKLNWLQSHHHFAFGLYGNPAHRAVGNLVSWADDEIAPGQGFALHPHQNMEIITYVREGAITHRDSLGNAGRTVAGDVQVMSAGSGVRHSEMNAEAQPTKIFQIWLTPRERGGEPYWNTRPFPKQERRGHILTLASGFPEDKGALPIRTDARVLGASLDVRNPLTHRIPSGRKAYLVPARGDITVNGRFVKESEGLAIWTAGAIEIEASTDSEIVLVESL